MLLLPVELLLTTCAFNTSGFVVTEEMLAAPVPVKVIVFLSILVFDISLSVSFPV